MNRRSKRQGILVLGAFALGCIGGPVAPALATVHVDPNGPAGQQYALPLDSARGEAAGNNVAGTPGAKAQAPLFGQGITPKGGGAGNGAGGKGVGSKSGSSRGAQGGKAEPGAGAGGGGGPIPRGVAAAVRASGSDSSLELTALIAAVVLLGAAAGLIMRRRPSAARA